MSCEKWKEFIMPFGKRQGWTMFQIYKNDFDYCHWLAQNVINVEVKEAAQAAVDHKNAVDPFSWSSGIS